MALRNCWTFWFGVTDRQANAWYAGPKYVSIDFIANALAILLGLVGIFMALRSHISSAPLYLTVLAVFPLIYYVTRPALRFRFTIEPMLAILAAYGAVCVVNWVSGRDAGRVVSGSARPRAEASPARVSSRSLTA